MSSEILGISHITFVVTDLDRTAAFLKEIFAAEEVFTNSTTKYFRINDLWLALNRGEPHSERTYNHVAFAIQDADFEKFVERIQNVGAEIMQGRARHDGESRSVYFYDYDNNLFELHTGTLENRLTHYSEDKQ